MEMKIRINIEDVLDDAFEEGYQEGFEEGKQRSASEACTRLLEDITAVFNRYKEKGKDCLTVEDAKTEVFIAVGHMFRKKVQ